MRAIYVPIADSFFESSIMQEELAVRFVMLALIRLALRAGAEGVVDVDLRTFAASIVIPPKDVERAIRRLMEPDEHSASGDEEGRRVVPVNPERPLRGWRLVNWPKYRHLVHKANDAARKRDTRYGGKVDNADTYGRGVKRPEASASVLKRPRPSTNGATKYEERNTKNEERRTKEEGGLGGGASRPSRAHFTPPSVEDVRTFAAEKGLTLDPDYFVDAYAQKGWMAGKVPMKDWHAAARNAARDGWTMRSRNGGKGGEPRVVKHMVSANTIPGEAHVPTDAELAQWEADGKTRIDSAYAERATKP